MAGDGMDAVKHLVIAKQMPYGELTGQEKF